jgi:hypothetical protein
MRMPPRGVWSIHIQLYLVCVSIVSSVSTTTVVRSNFTPLGRLDHFGHEIRLDIYFRVEKLNAEKVLVGEPMAGTPKLSGRLCLERNGRHVSQQESGIAGSP